MLNYANASFTPELDQELEGDEQSGRKKDYSRGRSYRVRRRRARRRESQPGCGIAARRNKRFAW